MNNAITEANRAAFHAGYIEALLWATPGECSGECSACCEGNCIDAPADMTGETLAGSARRFLDDRAGRFLDEYAAQLTDAAPRLPGLHEPWAHLGHMMATDGQGVGTGFYDYDTAGECFGVLSGACEWSGPFGELTVYRGDDGLVYIGGQENYGQRTGGTDQ